MKELDLTIKRSIELLGLCALGVIIIAGKSILMPLLIALFIAILLLPILRWLRRHRVPEILAISICLVSVLLLVGGTTAFLSYQIGGLVSDMDAIKANVNVHWNNVSGWLTNKLHFSTHQQLLMIDKQAAKLENNTEGYLQGAFASLGNTFIFIGLLPVYIFFILFYRKMLFRFILLWFSQEKHSLVTETVQDMEVIIKHYLTGLLIQIGYLTILVGGILLLFGIKHAILIGVTFAILNLVPYLGPLVGNLIGVILTMTSSQNIWQIWVVLIVIGVVQFIDNNILMPIVVGNRVKVNALASIVGIVIGGTMVGVSGMFISIPVMAVLKIVFDKSDSLRQWGLLIGDDRPSKKPIIVPYFKQGAGKKNN